MPVPTRRFLAAFSAVFVVTTSMLVAIVGPASGDPADCVESPVSSLQSVLSTALGGKAASAAEVCPPEDEPADAPLGSSPAADEAAPATEDDVTAQAVDVTLETVAQSVAEVGEPGVEDAAFITAPTEDGPAITGTVTFTVFGPSNPTCSGAPIFTSTNPVGAEIFPGTALVESSSTTFNAAGIYRWKAAYSGDANYNPVEHPCNSPEEQTYVFESSESLRMITDTESDVVQVGESTSDLAFFVKPNESDPAPTGTVSFSLYGPDDATCSGTPVFTSNDRAIAEEVDTAESAPFSPTAPGVYRWTAEYSGDENYDPIIHPCNEPLENFEVPGDSQEGTDVTLSTVAETDKAVGDPVFDTATLTAPTQDGPAITGSVTFTLYGLDDATCSGPPIFTDTKTIAAEDSPGTVIEVSDSTQVTDPGDYQWVASYSGDENYDPVTAPCGAPGETTTIVGDDGGGGGGGGDEDSDGGGREGGGDEDSDGGDEDSDGGDGDEDSDSDSDEDSDGDSLPDTGAAPGSFLMLLLGLGLLGSGVILLRPQSS